MQATEQHAMGKGMQVQHVYGVYGGGQAAAKSMVLWGRGNGEREGRQEGNKSVKKQV